MRGIKANMDWLINDLQAQFFRYKIDKDSPKMKAGIYDVQLAVRPIQLYELVFPKEALPEVQKTLWQKKGADPKEDNWKITKLMQAMRKVLGAQKMPKIPPDAKGKLLRNFDVAIQPVGIKEDVYNEDEGREIL